MGNVIPVLFLLACALAFACALPLVCSDLDEARRRKLREVAEEAVQAAQWLFTSGEGEKRKEYARNLLCGAGFDPDSPLVDNAIESAVMRLKVLCKDYEM